MNTINNGCQYDFMSNLVVTGREKKTSMIYAKSLKQSEILIKTNISNNKNKPWPGLSVTSRLRIFEWVYIYIDCRAYYY